MRKNRNAMLVGVVLSCAYLSARGAGPAATAPLIQTTIDGTHRMFNRCLLSPDASRIFVIIRSNSGEWPADSLVVYDVATGAALSGFAKPDELLSDIRFSPDGRFTNVSIVLKNNHLLMRVVDTRTAKTVYEFEAKPPFGASFTPDGGGYLVRRLIPSDQEWLEQRVDLATGKVVAENRVPDDQDAPSATLAAVVNELDGTIDVYRAGSRTRTKIYYGKDDSPADAAVLPDGKRVRAVYRDGTVATWDIASGKQLSTVRPLQVVGDQTTLVLHQDGERLLAFDNGVIEVFDSDSGHDLGRFRYGPKPESWAYPRCTKNGSLIVVVDGGRGGPVAVMKLPADRDLSPRDANK